MSAVDADGDSATTSLQVDVQGSTTGATALASTSTSSSDVLVGGSGTDATAIISSPTTGSTIAVAGATPGTLTDANVADTPATFTAVSSPTKSGHGYRTFPTMAATAWAFTTGDHGAAKALNTGDALTDIIGGLGAALLAGASGNDTSVKSSLAGSDAAQFDITDFVSGSDKIDLTALGSRISAILALTSTSSCVPAHTIAWLYDSKANQAIVYVNPTDQNLSIGDSGLVAIHLPGVTSVHLSDFVLASTMTAITASDPIDLAATTQDDAAIVTATTSDVSSDTKVDKGGLFVDKDWTAQTTNIRDSVDTTRDNIDSIDDAKSARIRRR